MIPWVSVARRSFFHTCFMFFLRDTQYVWNKSHLNTIQFKLNSPVYLNLRHLKQLIHQHHIFVLRRLFAIYLILYCTTNPTTPGKL